MSNHVLGKFFDVFFKTQHIHKCACVGNWISLKLCAYCGTMCHYLSGIHTNVPMAIRCISCVAVFFYDMNSNGKCSYPDQFSTNILCKHSLQFTVQWLVEQILKTCSRIDGWLSSIAVLEIMSSFFSGRLVHILQIDKASDVFRL